MLDGLAMLLALPQRVAQRDQTRLFLIAAEHVGEADLAGRKLHGASRHRGFAEIEGGAVPADPAAHHDEPGFGRADFRVRRLGQRGQSAGDLAGGRLGEHAQGGPAIGDVRVLGGAWCEHCVHGKLSTILDKCIAGPQ